MKITTNNTIEENQEPRNKFNKMCKTAKSIKTFIVKTPIFPKLIYRPNTNFKFS